MSKNNMFDNNIAMWQKLNEQTMANMDKMMAQGQTYQEQMTNLMSKMTDAQMNMMSNGVEMMVNGMKEWETAVTTMTTTKKK
ncbi:MAG TPA: hypothetical protein VLL52_03600 [Anaerolineae bacterium]|nr:hypothetical protein [Anaerolineae bacterium]